MKEALPLQEQLAAAADFSAEPERAEKAWLRLGALAEKLGDSRRAVSAYKRLLVERPLNEVAVHRLAALLEKDEPARRLRGARRPRARPAFVRGHREAARRALGAGP